MHVAPLNSHDSGESFRSTETHSVDVNTLVKLISRRRRGLAPHKLPQTSRVCPFFPKTRKNAPSSSNATSTATITRVPFAST